MSRKHTAEYERMIAEKHGRGAYCGDHIGHAIARALDGHGPMPPQDRTPLKDAPRIGRAKCCGTCAYGTLGYDETVTCTKWTETRDGYECSTEQWCCDVCECYEQDTEQ